MIKPSLEGIRSLAQNDYQAEEFCAELLREFAELVGADAGIVWDASTESFRVVSQYSSSEQPARLNLSRQDHDRLLIQAATQEAPIAVRSGDLNQQGQSTQPSKDQPHPMLLIGKFHRPRRYLIELMVSPPPVDEAQARELMQSFGQGLKMVADQQPELTGDQSHQLVAGPSFTQEQFSRFTSAIHRDIDLNLAAANVANESRRLLDCDRVSVAIKKHGRFRIVAISGQPSVNRRSNTTRLLEKVTRRVLDTGSSFWYPEQEDLPSPIEQPLTEYLQISATRSLVVVPVFEQLPETVEDPDRLDRDRSQQVIGGIVFEHCHQRWDRESVESRLQLTADHGGTALRNAWQHQRLFLYPVWRLLGKSKLLTAPRMLSRTLLTCLALIALALILTFWKVDFYVTAEGQLVPARLKPVYSKIDGDVERLLVQHGDKVQRGEVLMQVTSREHELRIKDLEGQLETAQQRLQSIEQGRFEDRDDQETVKENIVSLRAQVDNLQQRLLILREIAAAGEILSPIDGQIITWDLKRRLLGRSISRGQELLEVAQIDDQWEVDIDLPVRRLQHLQRGRAQNEGSTLPVSLLLAADTSQRFEGEVIEMERAVGVTSDHQQIVKLRASIDASALSIDQVRTGVTAKIYCGQSSLGYLWMHDIGEFLQKHVWFRLN